LTGTTRKTLSTAQDLVVVGCSLFNALGKINLGGEVVKSLLRLRTAAAQFSALICDDGNAGHHNSGRLGE
jgi:hypothetical protein